MKATTGTFGLSARIVAVLTLLVSVTASATEPLGHWQQKLEQAGFSGIVHIASSDKVIFRQNIGWSDRENKRPFDEHTVFDIGSLTKQFVATAVLLLAEQGKLNVDSTIEHYFPDVPADKQNITIHHLLSHSAGLPTNLPNHGLYDKVSAERFIPLAMRQKLVAQPGEKYHYSNIGYSLLAQVIERVSGQNWETYIRQHVLLPAGLQQTGYRQLDVPVAKLAKNYGADPNGLQRLLGLQAKSRSVGDSLQHLREAPGQRWFEGAGGFVSTVQDMHAWYLTMRAGQILTPSSWQQMFEPHIAENAEKKSSYGYGWLVDSQSGFKRISHTGSNGYSHATFDYYPQLDLFIFTASNDIDHYPSAVFGDLKQAVLAEVGDKSI